MRTTPFYIVGNWKSNKTLSEARDWFTVFESLWKKNPVKSSNIKVVLCPGFIHLSPFGKFIQSSGLPLSLGAQTVSRFDNGAYTGEVSAQMLKDLVQFTLVGHSERRKYFSETEDVLLEKLKRAREAQIEPIYCIQSPDMSIPAVCTFVGYEPIWAIGTGKPETPENANQVARDIKTKRADLKIIYGGSVNSENVKSYCQTEYLDGVLPGGASLNPATFFELISHAAF